jgi:hypothetical protein
LTLPLSLKNIGNNVFSGCINFLWISLYETIENIGTTIFGNTSDNKSYCSKLSMNLFLQKNRKNDNSINNVLIYSYTREGYPDIPINIQYQDILQTNSKITVVNNNTRNILNNTTCNAITQLRRSRIQTNIPIRFNTTNPYTTGFQYTQKQLDMRRKAEILQYNANNQNTKQNGTTKKQAFSQIVNNRNRNIPNSIINGRVCDLNTTPVPTSSSDVPGPIEYLYLDPSVILYNYDTKRNYNSYIETNTKEWDIFAYDDVETSNTVDKPVVSIYVRDGVKQNYTNFSLISPMCISVSGKNSNTYDNDLDFVRNTVSIFVSQIIFQIHYNETVIKTITIDNPNTLDGNNKISKISLNTTDSTSGDFSANIYIGNFELNNIYLYTPPNIIYDINILTTVVLDTGSTDYNENAYFSNITYTAIYNATNTVNITSNCTATSDT